MNFVKKLEEAHARISELSKMNVELDRMLSRERIRRSLAEKELNELRLRRLLLEDEGPILFPTIVAGKAVGIDAGRGSVA
jgi:hypothetical protein